MAVEQPGASALAGTIFAPASSSPRTKSGKKFAPNIGRQNARPQPGAPPSRPQTVNPHAEHNGAPKSRVSRSARGHRPRPPPTAFYDTTEPHDASTKWHTCHTRVSPGARPPTQRNASARSAAQPPQRAKAPVMRGKRVQRVTLSVQGTTSAGADWLQMHGMRRKAVGRAGAGSQNGNSRGRAPNRGEGQAPAAWLNKSAGALARSECIAPAMPGATAAQAGAAACSATNVAGEALAGGGTSARPAGRASESAASGVSCASAGRVAVASTGVAAVVSGASAGGGMSWRPQAQVVRSAGISSAGSAPGGAERPRPEPT